MTATSGGIFLLGDDGALVQLSERPYDSEDLLQRLLETHPELLAGDLIDAAAPRRWLLVSREITFAGDEGNVGRIDHVLLDQDGIPTFIEVKRSTDTRIRREVVGQMLEYVANAVVFWGADDMRRRLSETAGSTDAAAAAVEHFLEGEDPETWWLQVETNLRARRVRMLFVADVIPPSLQRIVEFLNEELNAPQVLAVEIRQYVGADPPLRSLVPRVFGQTAAAAGKRPRAAGGARWTEERFWEVLEQRNPDGATAAREIVAWARERMEDISMGSGKVDGSLTPVVYMADGRQFFPFVLWTYGTIEIQFAALSVRPPFDDAVRRRELRDRLNAIAGVAIADDKLDKRPGIPMHLLTDSAAIDQFIAAMDWALAERERVRQARV